MATPLQPAVSNETSQVSNETPKSLTPEPGFEGLEEVQLSEPGFEGLEPVEAGFEGLQEADRLDLEDEKTLIDDDSFRPAEILAEHPNLQNEGPGRWQKLINVYRAKRVRGLETGKVLKAAVTEAPGIIGKTIKGAGQLASRAVDIAINPAVNEILGFAEYVGTRGKSSPSQLREETRKRQLKAAAEIGAGTESAMTGITQLGTEGARKLFGKAPAEQTDNELYDQLLVDAEFHKATKDAFSGEGDFAKSTGLNASYLEKNGITLDKSAIENLSLVDPLTLVATAGVFKVATTGGKILATAATRAGAQAVINGLTKVSQQVATKSLNVAGRGVAAVGRGVQRVPLRTPGIAATGATLATGNIPGAVTAAVAPTVVRAGGRVLERAGTFAAQVGEQLSPNFIGPRTASVARLAALASHPAAKVAKTGAVGAVAGAGASAPLALASQDSQTAGAILGGGTALGTVAGVAVGGKNVLANAVAKKYLDPHSIPFQATDSPGYGLEPALDQTHEAAISQLATNDQNMVNTFRESLRDQGGEIYVQDPASYLQRIKDTLIEENGGQPLTPEQEALAQTYADTHAYLDTFRTDATGKQRRIVFLNNSAKGLPHDAGHLFQSLMSPERQAQLREAVFDSYSPEQLNEFAQGYVERLGDPEYFQKLGPEAGRAKVADEIVAENFSQLFGNTQLSDLKAPPKFLDTLARTAVEAGETLGLDLTGGRTSKDLQVSPAFRLQNILRNASREVLNLPKAQEKTPFAPKADELVPKEAGPEAPPTPADISPEAPVSPRGETPVVDETARRSTETGAEVARLLTEDAPEARANVDTIVASMESGNPALKIEHRGITAKPAGAPRAAGRTSRRGTQEAGYAELERLQIENRKDAPPSVVDLHEKTFVPVRWVEQGGKATLVAMSIDKVMANLRRVVTDATAKKATDLIPYETADGKLTEAGWNEALNDFRTYTENQSHGYRGDGQKLVRPSDELGASIPAEDPNFSPTPLDENKANFLNLIQGISPPKTGRTIKGQTPGNVKGQVIAEINRRQPQPVATVAPADLTKQTFAAPFESRTVKETNPLRNELTARGVNTRNLIEVTERFAAEDIASVGEAEAQFSAPVTDTIRGGFLPSERVTPELDAATANSRVRNEKGELRIVYHGTLTPFEKFSRVASENPQLFMGDGTYLSDNAADVVKNYANPEGFDPKLRQEVRAQKGLPSVEPKPEVYSAVLDLKNPLVYVEPTSSKYSQATKFPATIRETVLSSIDPQKSAEVSAAFDANGGVLDSYQLRKILSGHEFNQLAQKLGFDGIELRDVNKEFTGVEGETNHYVVFEPERIHGLSRNVPLPESPEILARTRSFLPEGKSVEEFGRELLEGAPEDFKPAMDAIGGLTNGAWDLGMKLTDAADVKVLKDLAAEASAKAQGFMKAGDFTNAMPTVMKAQFFREAYEAATGTGSAGQAAKQGRLGPNYKPPFPEGEATTGEKSFLPKRKKEVAPAPEDLTKVERDEKGRPLTPEGLIDYETLYKEMNVEREAKEAQQMAELEAAVKSGKYAVEPSQRPKSGQLTGWLLPDDEFVPLDTAFHEEWLAKNADQLNEDYGTNLSKKADPEERFGALQKGFVRIRYTPNDGTVRIEASTKRWTPATRRALLEQLEQHADSIDRVYAAVMDEKGNIVDSASQKVMELDGPEKITAFEDTLGGLNAGTTERVSVEPGMIRRAREGFGEPAAGSEITELGPKFLPSDSPRAVVSAAVRDAEGGLWTGSYHGAAIDRAQIAKAPEIEGYFDPSWDVPYEVGFVTREGEFLSRDQAFDRAKELGQLPEDVTKSDLQNPEEGIHTREFKNQRAFLPKQGTAEFDAYVRERIKESKQFPEAIPLEGVKDADGHFRSQYGDEPLFVTEPYDFNDSPLAKENRGKTVAESEELYTDALSKKLQDAYSEAKKNPDVAAGETWYSIAREKIQTLLGDDAQFFAELLGATSPNTAVDVNFGYAVEAYNLYKRGHYDKLIEKYREGKQAFKNGEIDEFVKETGKTGKKATEKAFLTWWAEKHKLEPTSDRVNPKTGQPIKFGFHTQPVLRVLDRSWLQQVEGPKTPNFTGNLSGATFQATIDVWAARLLRRLSHEGHSDKPWRIHPIAEQGVGERDFFTGQKAFRKAAEEIGIQPDALQAILWFFEKNHWEQRGWTRAAGAAKADYNVLLQTAEKTPEGQLKYVKPSDLKKKAAKKPKVDNQPELPNID